ncbi:acylneuraminate cytidylyltransferase [Henriciella aquimarina]|uniref:acylneuraminate cytidylyltransferase n=1 Tax=Henriciella aquimarina TaxID=545261 RepID=UPI0009FCE2EA|nr:acylneuraminate cytidylyltransferase [Henriciella aquimarina]
MKTVAIIPARGGSKGIPGKNLKPIRGRSLLRRAVEAASGASSVSEVYVTSDDETILAEAAQSGAKTIRRPADLANDTASSEAALLHAIGVIEENGESPDIIVFMQCTSPFVQAGDVEGVVAPLKQGDADCALTVTPFHGFLWRPEGKGVEPVGHEKEHRPRRQDRDPAFLETGAVYAMKAEGFKAARHRFFGTVAHHVVEPRRSVEIDEPLDLSIAEEIANEIETAGVEDIFPEKVSALLLDFDGVLTDDCAIVDQDGKEAVRVSRSDGMGIERLKKHTDIQVSVVSKETNPVVAARCRKLDVPCVYGVEDKVANVTAWSKETGIPLSEVVFVGNDLNDLPLFALVGLAVTPSDAFEPVRKSAGLVLDKPGGKGAVREICERLIARRTET